MRDAHEILKKISIPDDLKDEYHMILEEFSRRPISMTLTDMKSIG
jgi:hypothetical protein